MTLMLKGSRVLVVGASTTAERVIPGLVGGGAEVIVCEGGEISPAIEGWAERGRIQLWRTPFTPAMLWGKRMVVVTDPDLLREVMVQSNLHGVLVDDATDGAAQHAQAFKGRRASRAGHLAGTVALVGGGPGDPGLITVEGRRLLRLADVVLADHLGPLSLLGELDVDVEIIDAAKLPYSRAMAQERINELLVDRARQGLFVVRLKGGDPYPRCPASARRFPCRPPREFPSRSAASTTTSPSSPAMCRRGTRRLWSTGRRWGSSRERSR